MLLATFFIQRNGFMREIKLPRHLMNMSWFSIARL